MGKSFEDYAKRKIEGQNKNYITLSDEEIESQLKKIYSSENGINKIIQFIIAPTREDLLLNIKKRPIKELEDDCYIHSKALENIGIINPDNLWNSLNELKQKVYSDLKIELDKEVLS
jgi:hypothetical protein